MSGTESTTSSVGRAIGVACGAALSVAFVVLAFLWPVATARPKDVPVGIQGPAEMVALVEQALAAQDPAPLTLEAVTDREDAIAQISTRELYGAIILGEEPEVLIATAGSPVVAQALRGVAAQLQQQIDQGVIAGVNEQLGSLAAALAAGQVPQLPEELISGEGIAVPMVTVTDVVPLVEGDTTGSGLTAAAFPLVLGGLLGGVLISLAVAGRRARLIALGAYGLVAGSLIMLVLQTWLGVLGGQWWLNAAVAGLSVSATAAFVVGLGAVLGLPGVGLAAVTTLLVANPISSAATPPEFLAGPWGAIGQAFVPGASVTLLRSVVYFPDAATSTQWLTLAAWALGGVLLVLIGGRALDLHRARAE